MTMYFGCRRSDRDFLYQHEMNVAKKDGVLKDVRLALSREPGLSKVGAKICVLGHDDCFFKMPDLLVGFTNENVQKLG